MSNGILLPFIIAIYGNHQLGCAGESLYPYFKGREGRGTVTAGKACAADAGAGTGIQESTSPPTGIYREMIHYRRVPRSFALWRPCRGSPSRSKLVLSLHIKGPSYELPDRCQRRGCMVFQRPSGRFACFSRAKARLSGFYQLTSALTH